MWGSFQVDSTDLGEREVTVVFLGAGIELDLLNQEVVLELERWNLHLKEPWCVVGEQRHWPIIPFVDDFIDPSAVVVVVPSSLLFPPFGDSTFTLILLFPLDAIRERERESVSFKWQRDFIFAVYI